MDDGYDYELAFFGKETVEWITQAKHRGKLPINVIRLMMKRIFWILS